MLPPMRADRETPTGIMINDYLTNKSELDDRVVHLLFAANRWEKRCVCGNRLERVASHFTRAQARAV